MPAVSRHSVSAHEPAWHMERLGAQMPPCVVSEASAGRVWFLGVGSFGVGLLSMTSHGFFSVHANILPF